MTLYEKPHHCSNGQESKKHSWRLYDPHGNEIVRVCSQCRDEKVSLLAPGTLMTVEQAKELLDATTRTELRDHAFGDAEVGWTRDGTEVASGYFGSTASVTIYNEERDEEGFLKAIGEFEGYEARELRRAGKNGKVERNDTQGYDTYRGA